jgi:uncharacterized protein
MTALTWDAVEQLTGTLAQRIRNGFEPNMIVGVARGGLIPARLLSGALGVQRIASIGVAYQGQDRDQATLYSVPTPIQRADQILLVEDALETGRSLRHALSVLASQAGSVRTAAYFYRPDAVIVPDYCVGPAAQIPAFPWEGH